MNEFRLVALAPEVARATRRTRRDAWGNDDLRSVRVDEEGAYPCRACLEDALPGEDVLLLSHSPFARPSPYRTVGPIFIHEQDCPPFVSGDPLPAQLTRRLLALRSYDEEGRAMLDCVILEGRELEAAARRMLNDPRAAVIHVHNARPGCFACEIRRR